jgi:Phosphotransferase enzyme family
MPDLSRAEIEQYLRSVIGSDTRILSLKVLGESEAKDIKGYGYGTPVQIDYECDGKQHRAVLHTISPGPFGHEHMADRAQMLLWDHKAFNLLPRHVRSIDAGAFRHNGSAVSLGDAEEFFVLTEYAEGRCYVEDVTRMRDDYKLTEIDVARADALCDYLADIHRVEGNDPELYVRRIRELIGHSECIMGLIDSYPSKRDIISSGCALSGLRFADRARLKDMEQGCVDWRWRLKDRVHRLRQVHGDFHPWNILFRDGTDFVLLDRSRGEWGEPADDVTCLTMNYLFFSLQRSGRLDGNLESLFRKFWERYLAKSGDIEVLQVVAPFFAFRGLVMAHPIWYPKLTSDVRQKLFNFIQAVLSEEVFNPDEVNQYCGA